MARPPNVLVAQSGGPTAVINNSLRGVIDACQSLPGDFGTIYGAWHGIEGVLKEELLDLSAQDPEEISLLRTTPAAGAIGSCRYKMKSEFGADFDRVIEVCTAHSIGWFFYIGGNDSMDTANKISLCAQERGLDLVAVGIPKTIDNDLGDPEFKLIDHTPGYGSVARFWAYAVQCANEENCASSPSDPVLVLQAMGRGTGFIAAAARLADPLREMPLRIFVPEAGFSLEEIADNVNDCLTRHGRCVAVVSEGCAVGDIGARPDSFGHAQFASATTSAAQAVVRFLNEHGLRVRGNARYNLYGTGQRDLMVFASSVDLTEAYDVGRHAVHIARTNGNGWMSTILREDGPDYRVTYDRVALARVANSERFFPRGWIAPSRTDVTDDFLRYARPLIGDDWVQVPLANGLQRFARIKPIFAAKKCRPYIPAGIRSVSGA